MSQSYPAHLTPSELGTKEYWDKYYQNDLDNNASDSEVEAEDRNPRDPDDAHAEPPDPSELESWFDDVGAPAKTLGFLTSDTFPLSPNYISSENSSSNGRLDGNRASEPPTVLDLGTGNGSALFSLRLEGGYTGRMVGVDYSGRSVELARRLGRQYDAETVEFEVLDLIHDNPTSRPWWPAEAGGFDLVLDKGTFDAISLSSSTAVDTATGLERRICEIYPSKVLGMVRPDGFLLVTSCNWTEEEVVAWFTSADVGADGNGNGRFDVYDKITYPVYEFGGQKGQGVASVCFRRAEKRLG